MDYSFAIPARISMLLFMLFFGMINQIPAQHVTRFFDRYTTTDGLSHNSVNDLAKDRDGFLWIATSQGLNRFDGVHFTSWFHQPSDTTSLPGNVINALLCDPKNRLWIGTSGDGIALRNPETGLYKRYRMPSAGYSTRSSNKIEDLIWFDNTVIATCFSGSFYYDEISDSFRVLNDGFVEHPEIDFGMQTVITRDTINHGLWFRSMNQYYFIQEKTHTILSKTNNPYNWKVFDFYIRSTPAVDKNGLLWFQDWDDELLKSFSPKTGEVQHFYLPEILRGNDRYFNIVSRILCDQENNLWFVRNNPVQLRFHPQSGIDSTLFAFEYPRSLGAGQIYEILCDEEGALLVGGVNGLFIQRKNPVPITLFLNPDKDRILFAHQNQKCVSLFGQSRLTIIDRSSHETIRAIEYRAIGIREPIQKCFAYNDHQVLLQTTMESLWLVDLNTSVATQKTFHFLSGLSDKSELLITELVHEGDHVWAALSPFTIVHEHESTGEVNTWSPSMSPPFDIPSGHIQALHFAPEQGLIVAFGGGKGVYRLNVSTNKMEPWLVPGNQYGANTFPDAAVLCMHLHTHGVLYFSLEGKGLYAFDGQNLIRFDRANGLFNESIYKITAVRDDILALFHTSGVVEMNIHTNKFRNALHQESNYHTFMKESGISDGENGSLIYFYQNYIYRLDFIHSANDERSKVPVVSGFRVFDTSRYSGLPPQQITLNYSENFFTFSLSAFEFGKSDRSEISFKLEGFDPDWRMGVVSSEAAYTNVPPGEYTFLVRSRASGEEWGIPHNYTILIHPPFWQTWWFRILAVLALAAILYGIYRYRLAQILKLQAVRNKIASDLHDDIGSTLSSINIFSKFARDHLEKNPIEADELLKRINTSTVKMMDNMSDIVWSINPQNDTLKSLITRIRSHSAEVLGSMGIKAEFEQSVDDDLQLNMTARKNIFLIIKEAINNIARHSQATSARVRFHVEGGNLLIDISDDGIVPLKHDAPVKGGNGAKTIKNRMKELGGESEISESMKHIKLCIPLKNIRQ